MTVSPTAQVTQYPMPQPTPSTPIQITAAEEIALINRLQEKGIHPVLLFGTGHSGKTCMLLSLLAYACSNADANVSVRLGENVFPQSFPGSAERHDQAIYFYNRMLPDFMAGTAPQDTTANFHIFIPLDVTFNRGDRPPVTVKLAFLEGMGEWFERTEDGGRFKTLRPEVRALLERFPAPLSAVFLGPSIITAQGEPAYLEAHHSINNCLQEYLRRLDCTDGTNDALLMLATHWDRKFPPGASAEHFASPSSDLMRGVFERWPLSWSQFANMRIPGSKSAMPYSAGLIVDNSRIINTPSPAQKAVLDRFNRTIWNWLYNNATSVTPQEPPLYADVGRHPPMSKLSRLIGMLLWEWPDGKLPWRRRR